MQDQPFFPYLREILLFLGMVGVLIPVLQRLRINPVLCFLAVGVLVGPYGLALWAANLEALRYFTITEVKGTALLGEMGVLFLMFMIGLELSAERLWALRRWVLGAGIAQLGITALLVGAIAWLAGIRFESALILGLVLAMSSTAVVMHLLSENRVLASPLGQASFSILMLQDLAVVPLFILLDVLASGTQDNLLKPAGLALLKSAVVIVAIYVLGRRVVSPVFRYFSRQHRPEVFMALTLLCTLGIAALTHAVGLSTALGAMLAGLLLAETEYRHEIEVTVEPFKGLLMGLFFMSVGMQIDMREIISNPFWIAAGVVGLYAIKTAVITLIFRIGGFRWGAAAEGGLLLGQGGEFAFIIIGVALATQLVGPVVARYCMIVVSLGMLLTPLLAKLGEVLRKRGQGNENESAAGPQGMVVTGTIIIAGFGRVGHLLADVLTAQNIPYLALERDASEVARCHAKGLPVYFGDASRAQLLEKVHAGDATAIILTMDHPASTLHAVKAIRRSYPRIPIFVRSRDEKHAQELKDAGATAVIPETLEVGLQLTLLALQNAGMDDSDACDAIEAERERRIASLS